MNFQHQKTNDAIGIRISFKNKDNDEEKEIARVFLYILKNSLHREPFALMEDLFVDESVRGHGIGTKLIQELIRTAQEHGCYKLICTSRHENQRVHDLYQKLGFKEHGREFRIDF